jgi:hypothetical protein
LYLNSGVNVIVQTGASFTERMRITSVGNVGIGITPSAWSTANSIKALQNPAGSIWNFANYNIYVGLNYYWDGTDRRYISTGEYATEYQQNGNHIFYTAPTGTAGNVATFTERFRIGNNGKVTINTSDTTPFIINNTTNSYLTISSLSTYEAMVLHYNPNAGSWYVGIRGAAGLSSTTGFHIYSDVGGGDRLGIFQNGNYAFAGSNVSDIRLKENIKVIQFNAIEKIIQLIPKTYIMTNNPTVKRTGFIAQEVQQILPDLINGVEGEDEFLGLDYNGLLAISIKAIQELKAEIEELKNK